MRTNFNEARMAIKDYEMRAACGKACAHCGGTIGPDATGRPMCYGCAPAESPWPDAGTIEVWGDIRRYNESASHQIEAVLADFRDRTYRVPAECPQCAHRFEVEP